MSEFAVHVVKLDLVIPHPDADRLDIAQIGGFKSIVMRGMYKTGDLAIYIPENSLVPQDLLISQGLEGALSGSQRNKVKPKRLRGIFSEGLVFPLSVLEGLDVSQLLGVTKWEPTIPVHMAGQVYVPKNMSQNGDLPIKYDIENIKKFSEVLGPDEEVYVTEKIHGTFMQVGWDSALEPDAEMFGDGRAFVVSKGLGAKGRVFKNNAENASNLYVRTATAYDLFFRAKQIAGYFGYAKVVICGEVFGDGVQDLTYGAKPGEVRFQAFDIFCQSEYKRLFFNYDEFWNACDRIGIPTVTQLYTGSWQDAQSILPELTRGNTTVTDKTQIREGCVIKPVIDRHHPKYGRIIYKSISEDYLLRKNATELT